MLKTFCVNGTTFGVPEVEPEVKNTKETSEPEGNFSMAGSSELLLILGHVLIDSIGTKSILGNGQPNVKCSREGSYRIIFDPAFSMSPKMISGCVNMSEHIWGMKDALAKAIA